ncbi:phosphate ABC transporter permease subunit PstC [Histidinibacterium aquaticum]|uniref:Phosphate transport system permease protein n=1 Tax=Histidinibacterium aquaticum TaxID=2613962 RepID=A0A5J5GLN2_9RHOB|nr:phosphate ABC transporter permease subunit PstC [Histidinibacterium aquaticum]KAA9009181.1 phosphate ABC transporter permease subunit PstC [Histidinibacterium aquaticum]
MSLLWIVSIVLALAVVGYFVGRQRALSTAGGDHRKLHSLPSYYGFNVALTGAVPALLLLVAWTLLQPLYVESRVAANIPAETIEAAGSQGLALTEVRRLANGLDLAVERGAMTAEEARSLSTDATDVREQLGEVGVALGSNVSSETLSLAQRYRSISAIGTTVMTVLVLGIALAGTAYAFMKTSPTFRARNTVERGVLMLLLGAACIAILTTLGIVLSLIFNTIEFLRLYPAAEFFFGTTWSPSFTGRGGGSELGILPLLWGTLYISIVALIVAVPIGLFAAIYLSEYASPTVRSIAKPLLEVLAGIPTIVYGLFALLTVGPLLVDVFGDGGLLGVGWMDGGTAVMTAGLVMGIMLIPFVSSLSDDIINSVPQSMRDGSLGLGATHSETVRQVILPAALPGIVGAILLAASRAIGETMIVVLGAGAAARLSLNPFDAMTTVTAKIVSQLTGDADFTSPEALVAFALGMTLFVFTLGLNVFALWIVRRYREQYE